MTANIRATSIRATGIRALALAAACAGLAGGALAQPAPPTEEPTPAFPGQTDAPIATAASAYEATTVYSGLQGPWALAFLPDGDIMITQTRGQILILDPETGILNGPLRGIPEVKSIGSHAMHDLVLDPDFEENRLVYFTYFQPPEGEGASLWPLHYLYDDIWAMTLEERRAVDLGIEVVARARLSEDKLSLEDVEVLAEGGDRRINFGPDGMLYVSGADRFRFYDSDLDSYGKAELPLQDRQNYAGLVLRIRPDGSIPEDNPFVGVDGVDPAIFAFGFKDPEGAAINPETGELWQVEHGPYGGDEINIVRRGGDYGWPLVSYGVQYELGEYAPVGSGETAMEGTTQPAYYWVPSIAPSGMMFYTGDMFPDWQGDLFIGAMRAGTGQFLVRLELDGERVVEEEHLLVELGQRIRDIRQAPDGSVYVIAGTSIVRLTPKTE